MPRFYFHLFDELHCLDGEGTELPDAETAVALAREKAASRVSERLRQHQQLDLNHRIDIEDEDGAPVATVRFEEAARSADYASAHTSATPR